MGQARTSRSATDPVGATALIATACALAYASGLTAPFIGWDDPYYVTASPWVSAPGWAGFARLFDQRAALALGAVEFFPLRDAIYWVLFQLFGLNPVPYHLASLALHATASALVAQLARRLGFSAWAGLAAGLVFALHPVHVESVTWVSGLKDPLFLSLMLGSLLGYLRFREAGRPGAYAASLLLCGLALLSKSLALPVPLLLLAVERWAGAPTPWRKVAARTAPFAGLAALALLNVLLVGRAADIVLGPHGGSWPTHLALMAWAYLRYALQAVAPAGFLIHYCFPEPASAGDLRPWAGAAAIALTAVLGAWLHRRHRRLMVLWAWYLACLLPVANLVPFPALMADRYLYAPSVAVAIAAGLALERLRLRAAALAAVALVLLAVTTMRNLTWHDEEALWDEVGAEPACWETGTPLAVNGLLEWARTRRDPRAALEAFERVLRHPAAATYDRRAICDRLSRSVLAQRGRDPAVEAGADALARTVCGGPGRRL